MILESDMADIEAGYLKQIAELRAAFQMIIDRSFNDPLGTSKVIDMRTIAQKALNGEKMSSLQRT